LLVAQVQSFLGGLDDAARRVAARARSRAAVAARELDQVSRRIRAGAPDALAREGVRIDGHRARLHQLGRRATRSAAVSLHAREQSVVRAAEHQLERAALRLRAADATVQALDPRRVLERGYTITRTPDGRALRRVEQAVVGERLVTELATGSVTSVVEAV